METKFKYLMSSLFSVLFYKGEEMDMKGRRLRANFLRRRLVDIIITEEKIARFNALKPGWLSRGF